MMMMMMTLKQSSSGRNQKGKGYYSQVKLALQICVLLGICLWLAYQAKQFGNQKANLVEISQKEAADQQGEDHQMLMKLGRKNLNPRLDNLAADLQKLQEEDDEENKLRENEEDENDDSSLLSVQEKTEDGEHEQLEDLIDEDDSED